MTVPTSEFVPDWAKRVVWYQIFPERFRNGDPNNDPTAADLIGADPADPPRAWRIHPWGSDWYKLQDYEQANGEPELWKHLLRRRYGGDLQGIIDRLDYLQDLGIGALYLNPVFHAPSLHKYDGSCYHHIDPTFGPDPDGDRLLMQQENSVDPATWVWTRADELALKLIAETHRRGMRIIFDGVFNHMGVNSFAFQDLKKNQQKSPYRDWFTVTAWDNADTGTTFDYIGWWGVKSLPELREDENGIVDGPRQYIFSATERWMNPKNRGAEYGIDGWRLDVAFCVRHEFWKAWRCHVKSINPQAYLTAELVLPVEEVKPYLLGDEFDGEMNYNFAFCCAEFFFNPPPLRIDAQAFDRALDELEQAHPPGVALVSQNLFGSHDSNRLASYIVNRGIGNYRDWGDYFNRSKAAENPDYCVRKPTAHERRLQKLFVIFQMTAPGAPMVYYGDEVGMWGANDPDCRKPMVWPDIDYEPEITNPDGSTRPPDSVEVDSDLLAHYRRLIHIRNRCPALQIGARHTLVADDVRDLYVFARSHANETVVVALNNSDQPQTLDLPVKPIGLWSDLLNDTTQNVTDDGLLHLAMAAKWGAIWHIHIKNACQ
ncbi:alpha-glucosidase C-terminal domain-containing protein [candidate division KSB1 bacterium]|nr:alpha-glucosidase C-terminal domain-containing protein [candidate division KSB1 bacterium]